MESFIASYIQNMENFNNKLCNQINCIKNLILSVNNSISLTNENILLQYLDIVKNTYNILYNYEVNYRELLFDNLNDNNIKSNIIYLKENINNNIIKLYTINNNFEKIINSLLNKHCNNKRYLEEINDNNNNKKIKVNSLLNKHCNNKRYLEEIDDNNNKKIKVN